MPVTATAPEQDAIRRCLAFANLRAVGSTAQVEAIFRGASLTAGLPFRVLDATEREAYVRDQRDLRRRLAAITSGDVRARTAVAREVSGLLAQTVGVRVVLDGDRLRLAYDVAGVGALCALALGFVLDEARGLVNRLGRCGKPRCQRFNLTFHGK